MAVIKTKARQTMFDIAIQEFGSAEAAFEILMLNPRLSGITADLTEGMDIVIPDTSENLNTPVKNYLAGEQYATGNYIDQGVIPAGRNYGSAYNPIKYS